MTSEAVETQLSEYQQQTEENKIQSDNELDDENNDNFRSPQEIVLVGVQMFFSRTGEVDMVNQNFFTQFDLVLEWKPLKSEVESYIKDAKNFIPEWIPIIQFKNGNIDTQNIKIIDNNQGYRIIGEKCENTDVYGNPLNNLRFPYIIEAMYDVKGIFSEFLELHNFPMDCQDLTISMQLMDSMLKASFAPYLNASAEVVQVSLKYNGLTEYEMVAPVVEFYCNQYSEPFSAMNIRLKIKRKYGIYFWKIVMFVGLICLASLAAFTMHRMDDLADRYGLLFTLLLTQVAFQYVVSESLPNLTYLTLLDVYVVCGFVYLIIQIVGTALIAAFEASADADSKFALASAALFGLFQIGFMIWSYYARKYEIRKLTFTSKDYEINNYAQYKNMKARSKCYGVLPENLAFTKEAKKHLTGKIWSDLQEGR